MTAFPIFDPGKSPETEGGPVALAIDQGEEQVEKGRRDANGRLEPIVCWQGVTFHLIQKPIYRYL